MNQKQQFWLRAEFDSFVMETCLFTFQYKTPSQNKKKAQTKEQIAKTKSEQSKNSSKFKQQENIKSYQDCKTVGILSTTKPSNENKNIKKRAREDIAEQEMFENMSAEQKMLEITSAETIQKLYPAINYAEYPQFFNEVRKFSQAIDNLARELNDKETPSKAANNL